MWTNKLLLIHTDICSLKFTEKGLWAWQPIKSVVSMISMIIFILDGYYSYLVSIHYIILK